MPSATKTANYGLNQWQGNEYPKRQDFVDDNAAIDAQMKANADTIDAHKADKSNPHGVTAEQTGAAAKSAVTAATLSAGVWTGSAAPYSYTLSVPAVTATSANEILPGVSITADQLDLLQSANIQDGGQTAGSITLLAYGGKPTADLPVRIIVRGDL